jgi:hypothetical protein
MLVPSQAKTVHWSSYVQKKKREKEQRVLFTKQAEAFFQSQARPNALVMENISLESRKPICQTETHNATANPKQARK